MGKTNEIQEQMMQSFGGNAFISTVKEHTIEFDSLKDSFTFKDPVNILGSLTVNGQEITPGGGESSDVKFVENDESYVYVLPNTFVSCSPTNMVIDDSVETDTSIMREYSIIVSNNLSTEKKVSVESVNKDSIRFGENVDTDESGKIIIPAETTIIISATGCRDMGGYVCNTLKIK